MMESSGQFAGGDTVLEQPDCRVFVGDRELGAGTVRITESELSWSSVNEGEALTLDYPRICVHAVSRDTAVFPSPCVYLLYSASPPESSSEEDTDVEESPPLEIRLIPPHTDHLEAIYSAICDCQLLYPDPEQSDSSEEDEGEGGDMEELQECPEDFYTSAEGLQHLTAEGEAVLAHLESILHVPDLSNGDGETNSSSGQFEDAEEHSTN